MNPLVICYHGTNQKAARLIRKHGFRPGSYFARHLEDALGFGGRVVFGVVFDDAAVPNHWQLTISGIVNPDRIVSITTYQAKKVFDNPELRERVLSSGAA